MSNEKNVVKYCAYALAAIIIISIIGAIVSLVTEVVSSVKLTDDKYDYRDMQDISSFENSVALKDIKNMTIQLGATKFDIVSGDSYKIETNNKNIKYDIKNNTLVIKEKNTDFIKIKNNSKLILTIPEDHDYERLVIRVGVGSLNSCALKFKDGNFDLGTGKSTFKGIYASNSLSVDGGVGKLSIESGEINSLKLSIGVGSVNISAILKDSANIDGGVGSLNLNLLDSLKNYNLTASKGVGSINVNGTSIENEMTIGNGDTRLFIDGGVGSINVSSRE